MTTAVSHNSKTQLLNAAFQVIRAKGYAGTTVEDICQEAGVTKGSFFHHFKSKDELALSATAHWEAMTESFFASAPYHNHPDPLERLLGYVDFRGSILTGELRTTRACWARLCKKPTPRTRTFVPRVTAACRAISPS